MIIARIEPRATGIDVTAFAIIGGKEYRVGGYGLKKTDGALAARMALAMEAGAVYANCKLAEVENPDPRSGAKQGDKYVKYDSVGGYIVGRRMNAELAKRGF